jgi:hypothetical protein
VDAAFDHPELDDCKYEDQDHQDDRLGGRSAEIVAPEAVEEDLVDERHWVVGRFVLHMMSITPNVSNRA